MAGQGNSIRAIFFALGANFAIFVAKSVAAFMTGSGAMLAEAVHSLADCGNQVLLLLGIRQAKRPPSPDYPLGYGKAVYFWSFLVALMLFSVGGMFSLYEGWHKLSEGQPLTSPWIAIGVLVFSIIVESVSMRACLIEVNKARGEQNLWQWFRQSRQAELVVIFGEDLAALLGLVFALIAVVLTMITGNPLWDALGTLAIGALLIIVAILISIEVKAMLIGQSIEPRSRQRLLEFLQHRPEIEKVYNLLTLQLGNDVMVSVKAKMRGEESAAGMIGQINAIERELRRSFPEVRFSFFEPDVADHDEPVATISG
ncbi:MAG: cation transporter [Xanthomonadales bacterium]|uniref:cation diffusion facilitator family transporter n=2 Tax=Dokdonella sp. TaxID=2291710 RepID=UPI002CC6F1DC|nr:cation transporter [Xanthomonadales bacterium]HQV73409.1 cation diffusion facilitator family transporter [Dokdonella sp.]HQY54107.1 cation diffusion facilitator family transporter [Dokdonella sp.]HQZ61221.1 cation diffusion facilitator family transporter [Dokdonella sp.]